MAWRGDGQVPEASNALVAMTSQIRFWCLKPLTCDRKLARPGSYARNRPRAFVLRAIARGERRLDKVEDAEAVLAREDGLVGPGFVIGLRAQSHVASGAETRSEERRVGKECRSRWSPYH